MSLPAAVLGAALLAAVCASPAGSPGTPNATGSSGELWGAVTWSPGCPVEGEEPCPPPPAAGIDLRIQGGRTSTGVTTDAEGRYRVTLPAGDYRVELGPGQEHVTKDLPALVSVAADGKTRLDVRLDSGIR